jgi:Holliday junction resolvasome RuvABC endonuclease subunit
MSGTTKEFDGGLFQEGGSLVFFGIDQSYTGFAVTVLSETGAYYTWVYKSDKRGVDRLLDIEKFLQDLCIDYGYRVKDISIEGPVRMSHAALMSGELLAVVKMTLRKFFARTDPGYPKQVPPSTLKKYTTGNGRADKKAMMAAVKENWGAEFRDDNAADSYALAKIASKSADNEVQAAILKQLEDVRFKDAL